jgi:flagellin
MALSVLSNIPSLVAQNQLQVTNSNLQNTLFQLSSGSRINTGADDAAGLAIANGLQANISALQQSSHNASDGVGKLQVADGALAQVTTLLNRAVTLATESATSTVSQLQRQALNAEFVSIQSEITRIGNATNFNGTQIFSNGTVPNPNQFTTTATSNLTAGTLLTPTDATTVALGAGSSYTYTASATAHTNLNAVIGATATTGGTAIANGQGLTVTAGARTYTYLAAGGTGTVTQLIGNINAANVGFSAWLDTNGKVNIVDGEGTNNIVVSANTASGVTGAIANTTTGSTVQDLVNGINASGLGVTAGLAAVTNPNQLAGATAGLTAGTALTAGTLTFHAGTADPVSGLFADSVTFTAAGGGTVGDLITAINSSGKGFYASLSTAGNLEIMDNNYNGNITVTTNSMTGVIGTVGAGAATTQLVITDPNGRGDINVTNADAVLGFDSGAGGNTSGFYQPLATGASATSVFISDGNVSSTYNTISVSVGQLDDSHLGTQSIASDTLYAAANDAASIAAAKTSLTDLNTAISQVASLRGGIGAGINRLTSAVTVMNTQVQNLTSAASSIKDADIGQVVANMSKYQVLEQTGIAALAQANSQEQAVLKLLQ